MAAIPVPEAVSNSITSKQSTGQKVYNFGQSALNRLPTWLSGVHSKPNCSYNCLIGMALKSSNRKCLPVNEIYTFFLNEFPYFRNSAPDGWKNSIRHSLSLGPYFRKTQVAGFQGKKGFQWEVIPDKLPALEQEIAKFLTEEHNMPHVHQSGIESLPLTSSHYNSPDSARMRIAFPTSQHHESMYCSVITTSTSEKLKHQCKMSEPSAPPKEEIVGILAYLEDGAPQKNSAGLTTTTNLVNKAIKDPSAKAASNITDILRMQPTTDNNDSSQVDIAHNSSVQHDHGKWLDLELVDDVSTGGNEDTELCSSLVVGCLGMKQSLAEVNWSTPVNEFCKSHICTCNNVNTWSPQKKLTGCVTDDWLEPASDWNQWREPAYVERMINLSNSLQSYTVNNLNEIADTSETTAAHCTNIVEKPCGSKVHKCLGKTVSKSSQKGVKYCRRQIGNKNIASAAAQSTPQSKVSISKWCTTKAACMCGQNDKCLTSFQLIVSISLDHLRSNRHLTGHKHNQQIRF